MKDISLEGVRRIRVMLVAHLHGLRQDSQERVNHTGGKDDLDSVSEKTSPGRLDSLLEHSQRERHLPITASSEPLSHNRLSLYTRPACCPRH